MQRRGENSLPTGTCQRFMNFIFSVLSHSTSRQSVEVPIEEGSSSRADGYSAASEIVVEFKHIGGQENWETRVDDYGSSIHVPKKDASSLMGEQRKGSPANFRAPDKFDDKTRDNGLQEQGRSQEHNSVSHQREAVGTKGQKNGFRSKDCTNLLDEGIKVNKPSEQTKPMPPRQPWLLLSVPSNINQKVESFIQSKKDAWAET